LNSSKGHGRRKARERVDSDQALGDSLGIKLTPTLIINNHPMDPWEKNPEGVRAAIDAALQKNRKAALNCLQMSANQRHQIVK
jgi:hypothetical protein